MAITVTAENFHGWRGLKLAGPSVSVGLAPGIGGRIISLKIDGIELMFVQPGHEGETFDFRACADLDAEKHRLGFPLWGGDKTWVAPQSGWSQAMPPLELDAGVYTDQVEDNSVLMTSPVCRETGLRISRRVTLDDDEVISLEQTFTNMGTQRAERGIWDVTQVLRPFDVYLPCPPALVRGYENEGESAGLKSKLLTECNGWTRIPCHEPVHFKFGATLTIGHMLALRYVDGDTVAFLRSFEAPKHADYLHDANAEIYNSPDYDYLEIETHGPFVPLISGEQTRHAQTWRLGRFAGQLGPNEAFEALDRDPDVA